MWALPTYGRAARFERLCAQAPGGLPPDLVVYLTEGDGDLAENERICRQYGLQMALMPPDARLADIFRAIYALSPDAPCYGLVTDDHWPITPNWWQALEKAAGAKFIAHAFDPAETSPIPGTPCLGGDLVRAMGGLTPPGCECRHNYIDNIWRMIGDAFGLIKPMAEIIVQHHHPINGRAEPDATYERGSGDIEEDRILFQAWDASAEKLKLAQRVATMLGGKIKTTDLSKVHLVIATPFGTLRPDIVYVRSLIRFLAEAQRRGLKVTMSELLGGSHPGKAREALLWQAMRIGASHVLFIDDDMGFDENLPFRLIGADHDVSGVPGLRKQDEFSLCCNFFQEGQEFHAITKFLKVREVGFAFVMLKREAIERMAAAYPELKYKAKPGDDEWALFLDMVDDGDRLSEDLAFCRRWRKIGGDIWLDPVSPLVHAGRKEWIGSINDLFKNHDKVDVTITPQVEQR